ncbi:MAG: hypothetical protein Q7T76_00620 [Ferruginibacter sp.]|nr:hypothetical protein [Ferruginibacter sp.]
MRLTKLAWLFACFILFSASLSVSAQSLKEVFSSSETPIFYLGVDFTLARAIDAPEPTMDMRDRHFPAINYLIINEPKKYDLPAAFHKSAMEHDLGIVEKRNAKINTEEIKTSNTADFSRLQEADIKKLVSGWDFGGKKGVGLLIVVEAMSKAQKGASMWVTLVDMGAKKLLMTERMIGKTSIGFGFRNYWANPIRDVIEQVEKRKYSEWKSKYGG